MNTQQKTKGFTIIEVVLVLAIAGLIFLMVFTALPALQRSQRDTARKSDLSTVATSVTTYLTNNRSVYPAVGTTALPLVGSPTGFAGYLTSLSNNITSVTVAGSPTAITTITPADGVIIITPKTTCGASGANQTINVGTTRQFTVVTRLETGNGSYFCEGN